jgi:prepilin-type N-terminal cleavage/methylation domain-containing protein
MNRPFFRCQRGNAFTLVEILVVIAIIAILIAVIGANVSNVLAFAKRTKANSEAVQIQTAVMAYYQEYGIYPTADTSPTTDDYYAGDDSSANKWAPLIIALCGNQNPYSPSATPITGNAVPNTRNIAYLSPTHSEADATGRMLNPFGTSVPGQYFFMVVDTDYDGVAGDTSSTKPYDFSARYVSITPGINVPGGVAVWCSCDQPLKPGASTSLSASWAHTY